MCSSTSPRFFAASTINSSRSRTFTWPVNSLNAGGRSEISKAASGSGGFIGNGQPQIYTDEPEISRSCTGAVLVECPRFAEASSTCYAVQIFRQYQLCAAAFAQIIYFIKGFADEI